MKINLEAYYWPPTSPHVHHMIRRGPWKLNRYPSFEPQLFNLNDDPQEMCDRAGDADCRVVRERLEARLDRWRVNHPAMPSPAVSNETRRWVRDALFRSDLPELDAPWYDPDDPPTNRIDATETC